MKVPFSPVHIVTSGTFEKRLEKERKALESSRVIGNGITARVMAENIKLKERLKRYE